MQTFDDLLAFDHAEHFSQSYHSGRVGGVVSIDELARALAESGRVPWVRGMVEAECGAVCSRAFGGLPVEWCIDGSITEAEDEQPLLDLNDDGNLGHLLARARVLWGDDGATPFKQTGVPIPRVWGLEIGRTYFTAASEIEVIVLAIVSAPEQS